MWQEARANDKRIREIMVDHRKRAERRRAYFESRLGDPQQLIRVIGVSSKVYPNAEQFYYHGNIENLMPWQGNEDIRIDRFDGRSLLDYIPESNNRRGGYLETSREDKEMADELNFERYHDLIEAERLNVSEEERLAEVDEEWTKLLDRHQAKLALLDAAQGKGNNKGKNFGFDYGTNKVDDEDEQDDEDDNTEKESQLLKEVDILQYVDDLTDKDKQVLNEMSGKYGIKSYARLLRVAKKDRDEELRSLKRKRGDDRPRDKPRGANERRRNRRRNERASRRHEDASGGSSRYRRRHSPTYEPYRRSSDSEEDSSGEDEYHQRDTADVVIEFGSGTPEEEDATRQQREEKERLLKEQRQNTPAAPVEKKLTPMEKLKLKMRAGLEKQIVSDEKEKREKERERERANLQELARNQGLPLNAFMRPEPPTRESVQRENTNGSATKSRYRSPSSSPERSIKKERYRSPSPSSEQRKKYRSPSPSNERRRKYRSPSPSSNERRSKYRSPSSSPPRHSRSSSRRSSSRDRHYKSSERKSLHRDHHHRQDHRRSRSPQKKRYRSDDDKDSNNNRSYNQRHYRR